MKAFLIVFAAAVGPTTEERLARMEEKLDRLVRLFDAVFGEEFSRVEELQRTPGLLEAIREVESRYGVTGIREALVATNPEKLYHVQSRLGAAVTGAGPARLKDDASLRLVVVEVMSRTQGQGQRRAGGQLARMIAQRDPALLAALLPDLFERPGGTEAALEAACLAKGDEVAGIVRAQLPLLTEPREILVARAVLLAQGEEGALEELRKSVKTVKDDELLYTLARSLREGGAQSALWLYLELLKSERLCIIAASELSRLKGEKRPDPTRVRSERMKLYDEYSKWLGENYSRIRFDKMRRRFVLGGGRF